MTTIEKKNQNENLAIDNQNQALPNQVTIDSERLESSVVENAESLEMVGSNTSEIQLSGSLSLGDYIQEVQINNEAVEQIHAWTVKKRESTRSRLSLRLVNFFGASLVACFLLFAASAFNPEVDSSTIKDLMTQLITPQITLLSVALGFYFGQKDK